MDCIKNKQCHYLTMTNKHIFVFKAINLSLLSWSAALFGKLNRPFEKLQNGLRIRYSVALMRVVTATTRRSLQWSAFQINWLLCFGSIKGEMAKQDTDGICMASGKMRMTCLLERNAHPDPPNCWPYQCVSYLDIFWVFVL